MPSCGSLVTCYVYLMSCYSEWSMYLLKALAKVQTYGYRNSSDTVQNLHPRKGSTLILFQNDNHNTTQMDHSLRLLTQEIPAHHKKSWFPNFDKNLYHLRLVPANFEINHCCSSCEILDYVVYFREVYEGILVNI